MILSMKSRLRFFFLFVFSLLISCMGSDKPKSVAEQFLQVMNKFDFETAKKYGTEDTGKLLDMMSGFSKMMSDSARKEEKYEMLNESIDGDRATVSYRVEGREETEKLDLVKVNGKWKVAMSKDSMNE